MQSPVDGSMILPEVRGSPQLITCLNDRIEPSAFRLISPRIEKQISQDMIHYTTAGPWSSARVGLGKPYPRYLDTTDVETLESTSLGDDMRWFSSSAFAWMSLMAKICYLYIVSNSFCRKPGALSIADCFKQFTLPLLSLNTFHFHKALCNLTYRAQKGWD
jgi:hypothetical protein